MHFTVDSIRFQNASQHFSGFKTIAEMGIEVDTIPTFDEEDIIRNTVDEQSNVMDGYYYVTVFREIDSWDNRIYHYTVSLESVFDYFYGYVPEEDKPVFLEYYSRLEDTVKSDFVDYFLRLDQQIEESRSDTRHNLSTKYIGESTGYNIEIRISSIDDFKITSQSRLATDESVSFQLEIDSEGGSDIAGIIRPYMRYTIDSGDLRQEFPSLHCVGRNKYFRALYELEQRTVEKVKQYLNDNEFASKLTAEDYKSITEGILHACLGEDV